MTLAECPFRAISYPNHNTTDSMHAFINQFIIDHTRLLHVTFLFFPKETESERAYVQSLQVTCCLVRMSGFRMAGWEKALTKQPLLTAEISIHNTE